MFWFVIIGRSFCLEQKRLELSSVIYILVIFLYFNSVTFQVKALPFNDDELQLETGLLVDNLHTINGHGFLTINSQPNVNAAPSTDEQFGWGGSGGYIYQKAYLEFFMHKSHVDTLLNVLKEVPQVNFHIIDSQVCYCMTRVYNSREKKPQ